MMIEQNDHTVQEEAIEGLGDKPTELWGDYPIDRLLIRNEPRTVHEVLRRIKQGDYIMDPDFQRDFIWKKGTQSRLIESVLLRIPLPVFYLAEDNEGRMVVVDGLQRLSTFKEFVDGELSLLLKDRQELHNKTFADLPPKLQNRFEDCSLIFYIIDAKVPDRARLDIFERVNGGVPLTRQQMRNALYSGPATRFLKQEVSTDIFLQAIGSSLDSQKMRDREFVNRFCAFQLLTVEKYNSSDMDEFLAEALKKMNTLTPEELSGLSVAFQRSLTNNYEVFGKYAFRKHQSPDGKRVVINASLWDVMSTGLSHYPEDIVRLHREDLRKAFSVLMIDENFNKAITYGPSSAQNVRHRFQAAGKMFKEVLGDHTD